MKISVNFYLDELKPKQDYLTLNNLAVVSGVIFVFMVIWLGAINFNISQINTELSLVETKTNSAQSQLSKLQKLLVQHNNTEKFDAQKRMLNKQVDAKKMLLTAVGKRVDNKVLDYHLLLKELTEHHNHNLWLSSFYFDEKIAQFHGFALDSSAVTSWMTYLQSSASFKGREFNHLNLSSEDEELIKFDVATSSGTEKWNVNE